MAQAQENTTEDKNTFFIEASPVNDKAVKRLLPKQARSTATVNGLLDSIFQTRSRHNGTAYYFN